MTSMKPTIKISQGPQSSETVSYTHLDVYKRQLYCLSVYGTFYFISMLL